MVDNCTTQLKIKDFLHYSPLTVGKFIIICIDHTFTKYFFLKVYNIFQGEAKYIITFILRLFKENELPRCGFSC